MARNIFNKIFKIVLIYVSSFQLLFASAIKDRANLNRVEKTKTKSANEVLDFDQLLKKMWSFKRDIYGDTKTPACEARQRILSAASFAKIQGASKVAPTDEHGLDLTSDNYLNDLMSVTMRNSCGQYYIKTEEKKEILFSQMSPCDYPKEEGLFEKIKKELVAKDREASKGTDQWYEFYNTTINFVNGRFSPDNPTFKTLRRDALLIKKSVQRILNDQNFVDSDNNPIKYDKTSDFLDQYVDKNAKPNEEDLIGAKLFLVKKYLQFVIEPYRDITLIGRSWNKDTEENSYIHLKELLKIKIPYQIVNTDKDRAYLLGKEITDAKEKLLSQGNKTDINKKYELFNIKGSKTGGTKILNFYNKNFALRDLEILYSVPTSVNVLRALKMQTMVLMMQKIAYIKKMIRKDTEVNGLGLVETKLYIPKACQSPNNGDFPKTISYIEMDNEFNTSVNYDNVDRFLVENGLYANRLVSGTDDKFLGSDKNHKNRIFNYNASGNDPIAGDFRPMNLPFNDFLNAYKGSAGYGAGIIESIMQDVPTPRVTDKILLPNFDNYSHFEDISKMMTSNTSANVFLDKKNSTEGNNKFFPGHDEFVSVFKAMPKNENYKITRYFIGKDGKRNKKEQKLPEDKGLTKYLAEVMSRNDIATTTELMEKFLDTEAMKNNDYLIEKFPSVNSNIILRNAMIKKFTSFMREKSKDPKITKWILEKCKKMEYSWESNLRSLCDTKNESSTGSLVGEAGLGAGSFVMPSESEIPENIIKLANKFNFVNDYTPTRNFAGYNIEREYISLMYFWEMLIKKHKEEESKNLRNPFIFSTALVNEFTFLRNKVNAADPWAMAQLGYKVLLAELKGFRNKISNVKKTKYHYRSRISGASGPRDEIRSDQACFFDQADLKYSKVKKAGEMAGLERYLRPNHADYIKELQNPSLRKTIWAKIYDKHVEKYYALFNIKEKSSNGHERQYLEIIEKIETDPLYSTDTLGELVKGLPGKGLFLQEKEMLQDIQNSQSGKRVALYDAIWKVKDQGHEAIYEVASEHIPYLTEQYNLRKGKQTGKSDFIFIDNQDRYIDSVKDQLMSHEMEVKRILYRTLIKRAVILRLADFKTELVDLCNLEVQRNDDFKTLKRLIKSTTVAQTKRGITAENFEDDFPNLFHNMDRMDFNDWNAMKKGFGAIGLGIGAYMVAAACTVGTGGACGPLAATMIGILSTAMATYAAGFSMGEIVTEYGILEQEHADMVSVEKLEELGIALTGSGKELYHPFMQAFAMTMAFAGFIQLTQIFKTVLTTAKRSLTTVAAKAFRPERLGDLSQLTYKQIIKAQGMAIKEANANHLIGLSNLGNEITDTTTNIKQILQVYMSELKGELSKIPKLIDKGVITPSQGIKQINKEVSKGRKFLTTFNKLFTKDGALKPIREVRNTLKAILNVKNQWKAIRIAGKKMLDISADVVNKQLTTVASAVDIKKATAKTASSEFKTYAGLQNFLKAYDIVKLEAKLEGDVAKLKIPFMKSFAKLAKKSKLPKVAEFFEDASKLGVGIPIISRGIQGMRRMRFKKIVDRIDDFKDILKKVDGQVQIEIKGGKVIPLEKFFFENDQQFASIMTDTPMKFLFEFLYLFFFQGGPTLRVATNGELELISNPKLIGKSINTTAKIYNEAVAGFKRNLLGWSYRRIHLRNVYRGRQLLLSSKLQQHISNSFGSNLKYGGNFLAYKGLRNQLVKLGQVAAEKGQSNLDNAISEVNKELMELDEKAVSMLLPEAMKKLTDEKLMIHLFNPLKEPILPNTFKSISTFLKSPFTAFSKFRRGNTLPLYIALQAAKISGTNKIAKFIPGANVKDITAIRKFMANEWKELSVIMKKDERLLSPEELSKKIALKNHMAEILSNPRNVEEESLAKVLWENMDFSKFAIDDDIQSRLFKKLANDETKVQIASNNVLVKYNQLTKQVKKSSKYKYDNVYRHLETQEDIKNALMTIETELQEKATKELLTEKSYLLHKAFVANLPGFKETKTKLIIDKLNKGFQEISDELLEANPQFFSKINELQSFTELKKIYEMQDHKVIKYFFDKYKMEFVTIDQVKLAKKMAITKNFIALNNKGTDAALKKLAGIDKIIVDVTNLDLENKAIKEISSKIDGGNTIWDVPFSQYFSHIKKKTNKIIDPSLKFENSEFAKQIELFKNTDDPFKTAIFDGIKDSIQIEKIYKYDLEPEKTIHELSDELITMMLDTYKEEYKFLKTSDNLKDSPEGVLRVLELIKKQIQFKATEDKNLGLMENIELF